MAGFVDSCRFNPSAGGTTDWTYVSLVTGYQSPVQAGAQDGRPYKYRAESADLSQWEEGEGAYSSGSGVFARTTVLCNYLGTTVKINFTTVPQVAIVALKQDLLASDETGLACGMTNGKLVATASAGALTVAVKTVAGNDPSALDPVFFYFRNNTLGTGDTVRIAVTAALSVVVGSTKTLGATSGFGVRVWIAAFNNAGTIQIAAINCSDASGVYSPLESVKFTTAVPGNSSKAWYSTSAIVSAAPWRFIGFCEWTSLTTAGTWVAPDVVQLSGPGTPRPGTVLQTVQTTTTTSDTGTTSTSYAPSAFTASITPQSAANLVKAQFFGAGSVTGTNGCQARLQRGASWNGSTFSLAINTSGPACSAGVDQANSAASVTYTVYRKTNNVATTVQCPFSNLAGDINAVILEELMG